MALQVVTIFTVLEVKRKVFAMDMNQKAMLDVSKSAYHILNSCECLISGIVFKKNGTKRSFDKVDKHENTTREVRFNV